jgi:hypothetical protein
MLYPLQANQYFNFTLVGVGFFIDLDKCIVEKINRNKFVTHPRNPAINAQWNVLSNLTFWVGLTHTPKIIKILIVLPDYYRPTPTLIIVYGINSRKLLRRDNGNLQTRQRFME